MQSGVLIATFQTSRAKGIDRMNKSYPSLDQETRLEVTTAQASYHLNRKPQTLRTWSCYDNCPLRPIRINGRLAWPVTELRRLLATNLMPAMAGKSAISSQLAG
jgi:hypothetical protein